MSSKGGERREDRDPFGIKGGTIELLLSPSSPSKDGKGVTSVNRSRVSAGSRGLRQGATQRSPQRIFPTPRGVLYLDITTPTDPYPSLRTLHSPHFRLPEGSGQRTLPLGLKDRSTKRPVFKGLSDTTPWNRGTLFYPQKLFWFPSIR